MCAKGILHNVQSGVPLSGSSCHCHIKQPADSRKLAMDRTMGKHTAHREYISPYEKIINIMCISKVQQLMPVQGILQ